MKKDNGNTPKYAPVVALICALTLFVSACCAFLVVSNIKPEIRDTLKENINDFIYKETEETTAPPPAENTSARFMCAGNNVIYRSIYSNAASLAYGTEKAYDFSPMYQNIKSIISEADIAMVNQSTVMSSTLPVSTYPSFCSPTEVGDALYDLGFNVINHSNRNVFDKGEQGAADTLEYWKTKSGVLVSGLYANSAETEKVKFKEVNGIKIAFYGMTDSVQGTVSAESEINVICLSDRDHTKAEIYNNMKARIAAAKEKVDIVVVSVCFNGSDEGITDSQKETVNYLVSFGADVVIGYGISSIQPFERIVRDDGTSAVVYYSLGNLLSAEDKKENMLGGIADIEFEKNGETGETIVKSAKVIPIVSYYERNYTNFSILPAEGLTSEALASHALNTYYGGFTAEYAAQAFSETFIPVPDASFENESENTGDTDAVSQN